MTKVCTGCGEDKPLNDFATHPSGKFGRTNRCRPCKAAYDREYHARNRERRLAEMAEYREANSEKFRAGLRRWYYGLDPERKAELRARASETRRAWRAANPDAARLEKSRRRAVEVGAAGTHTTRDWLAMCRIWRNACAYCGAADRPLTRDHVIPLARGGSNSIGNIVPACGSCNSSKRDRTVIEWRARKPLAA